MAVLITGLVGSSGKKASEAACSATWAVAILAAGFVVVVMGRAMKRRIRGRRRDGVRRMEAIVVVGHSPVLASNVGTVENGEFFCLTAVESRQTSGKNGWKSLIRGLYSKESYIDCVC